MKKELELEPKEKVTANIRVKESTKTNLKIMCAKNNLKQSDMIDKALEAFEKLESVK